MLDTLYSEYVHTLHCCIPGFISVISPRLLSLSHPHSSHGDQDEKDEEEEEKAKEGEKRREGETRGGIGLDSTQGGRRGGGGGGSLVRKVSLSES